MQTSGGKKATVTDRRYTWDEWPLARLLLGGG
jgi:hypothetical protein